MKIPVTIFIYNRPYETQLLLNQLKMVKPQILFIFSDGPKTMEDQIKVNQVRHLVQSQINWECKITKEYRHKNYGLKKNILNGLEFVFANVGETIILEDDCIPSMSFFDFCEENLISYKNEDDIFMIGGTNPSVRSLDDKSVLKTRTMTSWGWATWKVPGKNLKITTITQ